MSKKPSSSRDPASGQRLWSFGNATLDEGSLELHVANRPVRLERKPLDVLVHLLRHAGDIVTKDDFVDALWPGRIVTETVIAKAVGKLRVALGDDSQTVIKTVHGYGYRLAAKVQVVQGKTKPVARFAFNPGDEVPDRPDWSLIQQLGAGGQGEVWLATNRKTREKRVFKFALDPSTLTALKREFTLFRFLNDSLGDTAPIVPMHGINVESSPCFLESAYVAGGNLVDWAESNGGLVAIPMEVRLGLAQQVASALATVHSVGVLHKDLKPSNVLVQTGTGSKPRVLLADFGSGGVLDVQRLEQLGITRLGFTRSVALNEQSTGTPLYLAPELLAGQPHTVKGDIYSLGVILYQLVVGEFRRSMSAGWERDIEDEIIRECIAEAAQGDPARRLGDAARLAHRLGRLDDERHQRRIEREQHKRAMDVEQALAAAKNSRAVADFLSHDLFSVVTDRPLRELTVRELLLAAAGGLADRFQDMPLAATQIHAALGNALWRIEAVDEALAQLELALSGLERLNMTGSEQALAVAGQLLTAYVLLRPESANLDRYQHILDEARRALGTRHPAVLAVGQHLAWARYSTGEWLRAGRDLLDLLADPETRAISRGLGSTSVHIARVLAVVEEDATALSIIQEIRAATPNEHGFKIAESECALAMIFVRLGRLDEAEAALNRAGSLLSEWAEHDATVAGMSIQYVRGQLRLRQGRTPEAVELLEHAFRTVSSFEWSRHGAAEMQIWLARAYGAAGRISDAVGTMRAALSNSASACGPKHPWTQDARIELARMLLSRSPSEARAIVESIDEADLIARVGDRHGLVTNLSSLRSQMGTGS